MKEALKQVGKWMLSVVSEPDGTGSSARVLTLALAGLVGCILLKLIDYLCRITDPVALGVWLGALPVLMGALVAVFLAPYGVNKASNSLSDIVGSLMRRWVCKKEQNRGLAVSSLRVARYVMAWRGSVRCGRDRFDAAGQPRLSWVGSVQARQGVP
jgi:hypothetical protein